MFATETLELADNMEKIVECFKSHPVAFPTETVYGLGAIVWREDLIKRVFEVKNRPNDNPLIVHVSSLEMLRECIDGDIPKEYKEVIELFWPGPLTLLFKRSKKIPDAVTAGGEYVAIRMPNHRDTLKLIDHLQAPIVGPSANKSTRPSPTTAKHVFEDLNGEIPVIIDGGACEKGVESTVVNGLLSPPLLLRHGSITYEELQEYFAGLALLSEMTQHEKQTCPGTRYKHYSPTAPVIMFTGTDSEKQAKITVYLEQQAKAVQNGRISKVGLLLPSGLLQAIEQNVGAANPSLNLVGYPLGESLTEIAHSIFDGLRYLDRYTETIYTADVENRQEGRAVMDRLTRASSTIV
ncbi:L-threonylcarbamoyladenylate synthase [Nematocida displodere]|uniref:Threonylcarbamoyl-AMP synthase n=1 Tax=Nematocida displodere TaxID=1805483 RepID=A0A177EIL1_9MICR|nr:L-threonylcarbamoyladenylate synthase [Nematocida displodere]